MRMSSSLVAIAPRSPDTLTPHVPAAPRVVLMHLPDCQRPQFLPWPEAARFPCNMHTCPRASGSKFSIQLGERHHVLTHLMVDHDLCRGATTVRPAWRHIHVPPRVQERQRLQLTMAPRRKRANPLVFWQCSCLGHVIIQLSYEWPEEPPA